MKAAFPADKVGFVSSSLLVLLACSQLDLSSAAAEHDPSALERLLHDPSAIDATLRDVPLERVLEAASLSVESAPLAPAEVLL
jgi:hypothetical protein